MLMENNNSQINTPRSKGRLAKALRLDWAAQTTASLCWIVSVFTYGISSGGDWLQLMAASSWLVANISTLVSEDSEAEK